MPKRPGASSARPSWRTRVATMASPGDRSSTDSRPRRTMVSMPSRRSWPAGYSTRGTAVCTRPSCVRRGRNKHSMPTRLVLGRWTMTCGLSRPHPSRPPTSRVRRSIRAPGPRARASRQERDVGPMCAPRSGVLGAPGRRCWGGRAGMGSALVLPVEALDCRVDRPEVPLASRTMDGAASPGPPLAPRRLQLRRWLYRPSQFPRPQASPPRS